MSDIKEMDTVKEGDDEYESTSENDSLDKRFLFHLRYFRNKYGKCALIEYDVINGESVAYCARAVPCEYALGEMISLKHPFDKEKKMYSLCRFIEREKSKAISK